MTLVMHLPQDVEKRLCSEATRAGLSPEEFVLNLIEERCPIVIDQVERNRRAIELLDSWKEREPDLEEAEGYPSFIEPVRFRSYEPQ